MHERCSIRRADLRAVARFLVPFGALLLAPGLWLVQRHAAMLRDWVELDAESAGARVAAYRYKRSDRFRVQYELSYRYDHRDYRTPASLHASSSEAAARADAVRYAPGTRHLIRVNPDNPHDIRTDARLWRFWILPAAFTFVGAALSATGVWAWRSSRIPARDPPADALQPAGSRAAAWAFLLLGGAMLAAALWQGLTFGRVLLWPLAGADVLDSVFDRLPASQGTERYQVRLRLRLLHPGSRPEIADATLSPESRYAVARRQFDRWTPGSRVPIRYNPARPSEVFPAPDWSSSRVVIAVVLGGLGLTFFLIGLVSLRRLQRLAP